MILDRFSLNDSVAIVTGAGQGIGQAIALAYAQLGCRVVCAARTKADVLSTCELITKHAPQGEAVACVADVTVEGDRRGLVAFALQTFGKITHLVNTVGGGKPNTPASLSSEQLNEMFNFNVTSAFHLTQLCIEPMQKAGMGNIINISSAAAKLKQKNFSAYAAVKASLEHLTRNLAQDLAPNIRVNAIAPGPVATKALKNAVPEQALDFMAQNTPLQCIGSPEDIASAAVFMATDASAWITGQVLAIDGGAEQPIFPG